MIRTQCDSPSAVISLSQESTLVKVVFTFPRRSVTELACLVQTNINVPQERKAAWLSYFCLTDIMALHLGEVLQIFLLGKLFKWALISSIQKWGCQVTRLTVRMVCIPLFPSPKCISSLSYSSDQIPSKKPVKGGRGLFCSGSMGHHVRKHMAEGDIIQALRVWGMDSHISGD